MSILEIDAKIDQILPNRSSFEDEIIESQDSDVRKLRFAKQLAESRKAQEMTVAERVAKEKAYQEQYGDAGFIISCLTNPKKYVNGNGKLEYDPNRPEKVDVKFIPFSANMAQAGAFQRIVSKPGVQVEAVVNEAKIIAIGSQASQNPEPSGFEVEWQRNVIALRNALKHRDELQELQALRAEKEENQRLIRELSQKVAALEPGVAEVKRK